MKGQRKSAIGLDNKAARRTKKELNIRQMIEENLAAKSRNLTCPAYLTPKAKKEWERIKTIDDDRGLPIIYDCDTSMLEVLCELRSAWLTCQDNWKRIGKIKTETVDGKTVPLTLEGKLRVFEVQSKLYAELRKLSAEMERQYSKFGMTPLGRTRFGTIASKDEDSPEEDEYFD